MKPIRSLLLSAGLGTRLRPLTLEKPKCLVEINKKPILEYWIDNLENIGIQKVLINTHYLAEKVNDFLYQQQRRDMKIYKTYEKILLGTAGTLIANHEFFIGSLGILIHADNFTTDDLSAFITNHYLRPKDCILTMLTFDTDNPSCCGIVQKDKFGRVIRFYEKSKKDYGICANGAIYAFDREFIEFVRGISYEISDFSIDILPLMLGKIFSWHTLEVYLDIGNELSLKRANKIAKCKPSRNLREI